MTGKTHCTAAVASAIIIIQPREPETLLLGAAAAFLGGLTPDVDLFQSKLGRKISRFMISIFSVLLFLLLLKQTFQFNLSAYIPIDLLLESLPKGPLLYLLLCSMGLNTKHRTFTHSLLGTALFTLCFYLCLPACWLYFLLGYLSHLFLDLWNKEGMELFFPLEKRVSIPICKSKNTYANALMVSVSICVIAIYLFRFFTFS
ncbi:MAG: metal-dependent hydrolase [Lachnospiraceae bacterium]|nr:metal-dependent hydrolase [Lachnospiraceae bacterium]